MQGSGEGVVCFLASLLAWGPRTHDDVRLSKHIFGAQATAMKPTLVSSQSSLNTDEVGEFIAFLGAHFLTANASTTNNVKEKDGKHSEANQRANELRLSTIHLVQAMINSACLLDTVVWRPLGHFPPIPVKKSAYKLKYPLDFAFCYCWAVNFLEKSKVLEIQRPHYQIGVSGSGCA